MDSDHPGVDACSRLFADNSGMRARPVLFDFSGTRFLGPIPVAFLGAFRTLLERRHCKIEYSFTGCKAEVYRHLTHCGLIDVKDPIQGSSIAFRQFTHLDADAIAHFIIEEWLLRGNFSATSSQVEYVASSVGELFVNGFTHSESPIGVVAYGQYFPRLRYLKLVVLDLGVGIPETIRRKLPHRSGWLRSGNALEWAFKKGHSGTSTARGLGLSIMKEFIMRNHGRMQVYSLNGYATIAQREFFYERRTSFPGTAIEISLRSIDFVPKPAIISI